MSMDRVCWLPPSALPAVRDWLAVRGPAPELLLPVRKGGRIEDRALSAQAARDLCRELARLPPPSHSRPTICAGPGPATCSTPAATSRSCSSWPATPARPPPHATIAAPRPPGAGPPSCSTCPTSRPIRRRPPRLSVAQRLEGRAGGSPRIPSGATIAALDTSGSAAPDGPRPLAVQKGCAGADPSRIRLTLVSRGGGGRRHHPELGHHVDLVVVPVERDHLVSGNANECSTRNADRPAGRRHLTLWGGERTVVRPRVGQLHRCLAPRLEDLVGLCFRVGERRRERGDVLTHRRHAAQIRAAHYEFDVRVADAVE